MRGCISRSFIRISSHSSAASIRKSGFHRTRAVPCIYGASRLIWTDPARPVSPTSLLIYALIVFFMTRLDAQRLVIEQKNHQLEHLSATDPLTGAYNRRGFLQRLNEEIGRADRFEQPLCVILLDVDHFKRVNDAHGHQVGDEVLLKLGQTVARTVRGSDVFGRWGGEEFILMVPQEDLANAELIAEKLRTEVAATAMAENVAVTISLGVSRYRRGEAAVDLIARADQALYAAKAGGRNRTVVMQQDPVA